MFQKVVILLQLLCLTSHGNILNFCLRQMVRVGHVSATGCEILV